MKKPNKKPELTIEYVIQTLETDSCYYCAYGCEAPPSCEADCSYKDAVCKAIDYLKEYKKWKNHVCSDNCAIDYQSWEN